MHSLCCSVFIVETEGQTPGNVIGAKKGTRLVNTGQVRQVVNKLPVIAGQVRLAISRHQVR